VLPSERRHTNASGPVTRRARGSPVRRVRPCSHGNRPQGARGGREARRGGRVPARSALVSDVFRSVDAAGGPCLATWRAARRTGWRGSGDGLSGDRRRAGLRSEARAALLRARSAHGFCAERIGAGVRARHRGHGPTPVARRRPEDEGLRPDGSRGSRTIQATGAESDFSTCADGRGDDQSLRRTLIDVQRPHLQTSPRSCSRRRAVRCALARRAGGGNGIRARARRWRGCA